MSLHRIGRLMTRSSTGGEAPAMPMASADITMSLDGYVTGPGADSDHGLW
jgi:hypothetical protein